MAAGKRSAGAAAGRQKGEALKITKSMLKAYKKTKRVIQLMQAELEEIKERQVSKLIKDREQRLRENHEKLEAMDQWIDAIEDDETRLVFDLYYRKGRTWKQIAMKMGGIYSEDYVRKLIRDKYLKEKGML